MLTGSLSHSYSVCLCVCVRLLEDVIKLIQTGTAVTIRVETENVTCIDK